MTLRGNVQDFPLRAVLEMLGQTKKTGELQLRVADRVGALGLAGGRVVTSVFAEEEPLLALGAIFGLEGAEFEFTPWDDAPPSNLEGTLDDLLRKADLAKKQAEEARRKAEAEREAARKKVEAEKEAERKRLEELRALIPSDDVAFRLSERAVDQGAVTLTSERWRVVLAVNGERDVNGIATMLHLDHDAALSTRARRRHTNRRFPSRSRARRRSNPRRRMRHRRPTRRPRRTKRPRPTRRRWTRSRVRPRNS